MPKQNYVSTAFAFVTLCLWVSVCGYRVAEAAGFSSAAPIVKNRIFHTTTLLPSGKLLVAGGTDNSLVGFTQAELYDPVANAWSPAANLVTGRYNHTAMLLDNGKVMVVGGENNSAYLTSVEIYDPNTNTWSPGASLSTGRGRHTATHLSSLQILVAGGLGAGGKLASAELYDISANTWTAAGALATARYSHAAALLPGGKVLVTGGALSSFTQAASVEIYDPASNSWSAAASMANARQLHSATVLTSGKVLVAGGIGNSGDVGAAELFDPGANTWASGGTMIAARDRQTATLLPSGKLLATGGEDASGTVLGTAELYDPGTNVWTAAGSLSATRYFHTATLLPSGRVAIVAGRNNTVGPLAVTEIYDSTGSGAWSGAASMAVVREEFASSTLQSGRVLVSGGRAAAALSSAEQYDPGANAWSAAGAMIVARYDHRSTTLLTGKVLATGGNNGTSTPTNTTELYDPTTNSWLAGPAMTSAHAFHTATVMPNGNVLVAGGYDAATTVNVAEVYDPIGNRWLPTPPMATARSLHCAVLLPSGKVLVAGGEDPASNTFASAEIYNPFTNSWSNAASMNTSRSEFTMTLLSNGKVLVAGGLNDAVGLLSSAEIYDPIGNTWTTVAPLTKAHFEHSAIALSNGRMLLAGGGPNASLSDAEVYDPVGNAWTTVAALSSGRKFFGVALLSSGKVLAIGGISTGSVNLSSAELFDTGLGFAPGSQPTIGSVTSPLTLRAGVTVQGANFKGSTEASGGNGAQNSTTNYPLVQVQSLVNGQSVFLTPNPGAFFSGTLFTSQAGLGTFPPGGALVTVITNGVPSDAKQIQVTLPASNTVAANASAIFKSSAQNVTLSANVAGGGIQINEGAVVFVVKQGATVIGVPTASGSVTNGLATASYSLPASTPAATYSIEASYTGSPNIAGSGDNSKTLTITSSQAATTTTVVNATVEYRDIGVSFNAAANVTSPSGTVNEGTVTFQVKNGATNLGLPVISGTVTGGTISQGVSVLTDPPLAPGVYTIKADYSGSNNFLPSSDAAHTLTVTTATTTLAAQNATTVFSANSQTVQLNAVVSGALFDNINEGTMTFAIKKGGNIKGTPVTSNTVANGLASVSYTLPAGLEVDDYTIDVSFSGGPKFKPSSDAAKTLRINGAAPKITSALTATGVVGVPFAYSIVATGTTPIIFSAAPLPSGLSLNGTTISGTPATVGTINITLGASNNSGSDSQTLMLTINPNGAAAITSALAVSGTVGTAFTYTITASGTAPLTFSTSTLPDGLIFSSDTATISGTPTTAGVYSVSLTVNNTAGVDTKTLVITINASGAPTITSALAATGKVATAFTYTITATGTGPITFSATNLPAWLTFDNVATISGTPGSGDVGVNTVTVSASNSGGSDVKALSITIAPSVTTPPLIASVTPSRNPVRTGAPVTFTAEGLSLSGLPLTYTWFVFFGGIQDGQPVAGTPLGQFNSTFTRSFPNEGQYFVAAVAFDGFQASGQVQKISVTLQPNSSGVVKNVVTGNSAINPVGNLGIKMSDSDSGVVDLDLMDSSSLAVRAAGETFNTELQGVTPPANTAFDSTALADKYGTDNIFVVKTTASKTGGTSRKARLMIPVGVNETGSTKTDDRVNKGFQSFNIKGKFAFGSKSDTITLTGDMELPSGLDFSQGMTLSLGIGNIVTNGANITSKGKVVGAQTPFKKVQFTLPRVNKTTHMTKPGDKTKVSISMSGSDFSAAGFDTDGIAKMTVKATQTRSVQVALVIGGIPYYFQAAVQYKYDPNSGFGNISGRSAK